MKFDIAPARRHFSVFALSLACAAGVTATSACGGGDTNPDEGPFIEVLSITPERGPLAGGNTVIVAGEGFASGGVDVNNLLAGDALSLDIDVISDTELRVTMPPGQEPGPVDLTLFNGNGSVVIEAAYSYNPLPTVTDVNPAIGPSAGGQEVTLKGKGFESLEPGDNFVFIGNAPATISEVRSDTEMVVTTPPGLPPILLPVRVENDNGVGELGGVYRYQNNDGLLTFRQGRFPFVEEAGEILAIDLETLSIEIAAEGTGRKIDDFKGEGVSVPILNNNEIVYKSSNQTMFRITGAGEHVQLGRVDGCAGGKIHAMTVHQGQVFAICRDNNNNGNGGNGSSDFGTINLDTLTFAPIGSVDVCCVMNLASDGETLFFMRDRDLFSMDPANGNQTLLAQTSLSRVRGLVFHQGSLFAVNRGFGGGGGGGVTFLYRLNPADGSSEFLMDLGPGMHGLTEIPQ